MGTRTGSGDDALLQDGLGRIELAPLGRSELGELGEFAGPSVRRPESSLARRPGHSSSPRWTSRKSDSDTFLSHTTGAGEPPCWSCVLVLGAVGPKLGRQPQRSKLVLHLVQGLGRRRRARSTGTMIARWSDRASVLGLHRRGRNHWLQGRRVVAVLQLSYVVSRGPAAAIGDLRPAVI